MKDQEQGLEMSAEQQPSTDLSMSVIARLRLQRTHPAAWLWLSVAVIVLHQATNFAGGMFSRPREAGRGPAGARFHPAPQHGRRVQHPGRSFRLAALVLHRP